jgi:hypothetical protein
MISARWNPAPASGLTKSVGSYGRVDGAVENLLIESVVLNMPEYMNLNMDTES